MRVRTGFNRTEDTAADLDVAVGIVRIHDCECDWRGRFQGPRWDAAVGGVHADVPAVVIEPHWYHLRRSIRHYRSQTGKRFLLTEEVEVIVGNAHHFMILAVEKAPVQQNASADD